MTGSQNVPTVELFDSEDGLIFSFTSGVSSTQERLQQKPPNTPQPESQTQQETTQQDNETPTMPEAVSLGSEAQQGETSAQEDDPIEIVVTGEQVTVTRMLLAAFATVTTVIPSVGLSWRNVLLLGKRSCVFGMSAI